MKKKILLFIVMIAIPVFAMSEAEIKEAYQKSYQYEESENYVDAIKSIWPVYKEYPKTYTVNLRLGWLFYLNKNYANSLDAYERAAQISPNSIEAQLGQLLPLMAQDRNKDVEKIAFQILENDYYNYYGNLRLSYALRKQEKYDSAEKVALKMLTVYPTDVLFLTEYGLTKDGRGEVEKAITVFLDILILDPENVIAKEYLKE